MAKSIMYVEGADGQVEMLPDRIIIHRKGIFNILKYGINSRREIPLASISSVNFKEAGRLTMGEIDFDYAGHAQTDKKQNAVRFSRKHQEGFLRLKEKIFAMMQQGRK